MYCLALQVQVYNSKAAQLRQKKTSKMPFACHHSLTLFDHFTVHKLVKFVHNFHGTCWRSATSPEKRMFSDQEAISSPEKLSSNLISRTVLDHRPSFSMTKNIFWMFLLFTTKPQKLFCYYWHWKYKFKYNVCQDVNKNCAFVINNWKYFHHFFDKWVQQQLTDPVWECKKF